MSRTYRGSKGTGYDFWSRRPRSGNCYGKIAKWMTKRVERQEDRKLERQALTDPDNVRGRIKGE